MAIAYGATLLGEFVSTGGGGTTITTSGSYAPTSNELICVFIHGDAVSNGDDEAPSGLTANSLSWTNRAEVACQSGWDNISLWTALGASPSSSTMQASYTNSQEGAEFSIFEFSGINTTTPIVQTATNGPTSATSMTVTLGAFSDAGNATIGGFGRLNGSVNTSTPGTGFTEIYDGGNDYGDWAAIMATQYQLANDTSVDCSWSGSYNVGGIAAEIAVAAAGGFQAAWARNANTIIG